ncbi:MAG: deoxyribonuclease IV [Deltaproteobacteria bacterium]|jgi:deoxyribonuclease-4|nr:deoxyribonuclease IV [Deltaproteobacteria bacterium]MCW9049496.1 deoxyribonuclease IV [Deltaproteobacteria bacterium]
MPVETKGPLLLGTHVSIAGGIEKAIARGEAIGCTAIQIFTRNASRWESKPLEAEAVKSFRNALDKSRISYVAGHDSYLINLASPDENLRKKSIDAFLDEMERCHQLGVGALVMHPGAHMGHGQKAGLIKLAASFRSIFPLAPDDVRVLLENTAGQGTCLGASFEELAEIIDLVPEGNFGVCLDSCHAFAAGYDLSSRIGYNKLMDEIDHLIGTERIALFHLNDSKKPLGSRVDRHEHVGKGLIGPPAFQLLMQDQRFLAVAKIIETPSGDNNCHDFENLALLRTFAQCDREIF